MEGTHSVGVLVFAGVCFAGFVGAVIAVTLQRRKNCAWQQMDTLAEYLIRYPFCDTPRGIQCAHCASQSIQVGGDASRKFFTYSHCGARLYRQS